MNPPYTVSISTCRFSNDKTYIWLQQDCKINDSSPIILMHSR